MKTITSRQLSPAMLDALDALDLRKTNHININARKHRFVVLKKEDYDSWVETSFLLSSSKNAEVLKKSLHTPLSKCKDYKDVIKNMDC